MRRRLLLVGFALAAVAAAGALWAPAGGAVGARVASSCRVTQTKSLAGKVPAVVKFVNKTSGTVQLYWLSYTGTLVFYYTVPAGKTLAVKTWATNPWLALNARFVCVGYVIPPKPVYVIG